MPSIKDPSVSKDKVPLKMNFRETHMYTQTQENKAVFVRTRRAITRKITHTKRYEDYEI